MAEQQPRAEPLQLEQPQVVRPQPEQPPRRRWGCCSLRCGCLTISAFLGVLAILVGVGAALYFRVPERLGLRESAADRLLSGAPDREAAAAILTDLEEAGVNTQGVELWVLPISGKGGILAYAILDSSQGFTFEDVSSDDPVTDYLIQLAAGDAAEEYGIERVAFDYLGESGDSLLVITASTEAISGFTAGTIDRSQFLKEVEAKADLPALVQEVLQ